MYVFDGMKHVLPKKNQQINKQTHFVSHRTHSVKCDGAMSLNCCFWYCCCCCCYLSLDSQPVISKAMLSHQCTKNIKYAIKLDKMRRQIVWVLRIVCMRICMWVSCMRCVFQFLCSCLICTKCDRMLFLLLLYKCELSQHLHTFCCHLFIIFRSMNINVNICVEEITPGFCFSRWITQIERDFCL